MPADDRLWSHDETAQYLHVSPWTLHYLRAEGHGPRCVRVGKHRRYDPQDVRDWLKANTSNPARGKR